MRERSAKFKQLTRKTVTQGSIIALPTYPVLFAVVGTLLLVQDPSRTSSQPFAVARSIMEISSWGMLFLAIAFVELAALVLFSRTGRRMFIKALILGAGVSAFWGVLLIMSASENPAVSYTSGAWVLAVAVFHIASTRSLARDLVST